MRFFIHMVSIVQYIIIASQVDDTIRLHLHIIVVIRQIDMVILENF